MRMVETPACAGCLLPPHRGEQDPFRESEVPARSQLYSLAPYEIETIWRESLTGYIMK